MFLKGPSEYSITGSERHFRIAKLSARLSVIYVIRLDNKLPSKDQFVSEICTIA
jgi:hypothetical protein